MQLKTIMDAIRKKMQSLKGETDSLYATIQKFEDATKESNRLADQVVIRQIREYLKNDLGAVQVSRDEEGGRGGVSKMITWSHQGGIH